MAPPAAIYETGEKDEKWMSKRKWLREGAGIHRACKAHTKSPHVCPHICTHTHIHAKHSYKHTPAASAPVCVLPLWALDCGFLALPPLALALLTVLLDCASALALLAALLSGCGSVLAPLSVLLAAAAAVDVD